MAFESWTDRQIREAERRGEFDNLPGAGKPLKRLDKPQDDDWWVKGLIEREKLPPVLPTSLALRKEAEDLPDTVRPLWREDAVREVVDDLNGRIVEARRRPSSGPPVFIKMIDVDEAVAAWKNDREHRRAASSTPAESRHDVSAGEPKPRQRGWFGRRRRTG